MMLLVAMVGVAVAPVLQPQVPRCELQSPTIAYRGFFLSAGGASLRRFK